MSARARSLTGCSDVSAGGRFGRNALLLWAAQFISAAGDALFLPCLTWLAASTGDGDGAVGLAVFVAFVPYLLFGPLVGAWVDRTDRRRLMVVSDLARAALLLSLPLLVAAVGGLDFALIVVVGFMLATFSTPFLPSRDALLPSLVGARSLPRWNALMQTSGQLAMILGLGLGGLLLGGNGGGTDEAARVVWVLQIDGATYVLSAILLALIVLPRESAAPRPETHLLPDTVQGLRYARRHRVVWGLLVLTALDNLAIMGPAIVGTALLVKHDFGLQPQHYAWLEAAMAGGMVLGSLWLATWGRRLPMRTLVLWGMVMDGLTYLPFVWLPDYTWALPMIVAHGVFIPFIIVGRTSLIQRRVPAERRGKVFALVSITVVGMTALSAAASGIIAEATSPRVLFGLAGSIGALCGVAGFFLWRFDEEPTTDAAEGQKPTR